MADTTTIRQRFRARLLTDAQNMLDSRLGSIAAPPRIVNVVLPLGARGAPLQGGEDQVVRLSLNGHGTVLTWSLAALVGGLPTVGAVTVDVLRGSTLATLTRMAPSSPPHLVAQYEVTEQPPTGWDTDLPDPCWLFARALAVDGVLEEASLTLKVAIRAGATTLFVTDSTGALFTDDTGAPYQMEP